MLQGTGEPVPPSGSSPPTWHVAALGHGPETQPTSCAPPTPLLPVSIQLGQPNFF
jgi:hypothetical protein